MRLLLVEDNQALAEAICLGMKGLGHTIDAVHSAEHGLLSIQSESFDAVLLDINLPNMSGLQLLQKIRSQGQHTAVIMLTARDTTADKIAGLDMGADDYLVKPFALDEVVARLQALIRRSQGRSQTEIRYGDVSYLPQQQQVFYQGKWVDLTAKEITVLEQFISYPNLVHSRASLEDKLYGWQQDIESNAIEVHIHNLRKKLGNDFILTRRGIGYYLNPALQRPE